MYSRQLEDDDADAVVCSDSFLVIGSRDGFYSAARRGPDWVIMGTFLGGLRGRIIKDWNPRGAPVLVLCYTSSMRPLH